MKAVLDLSHFFLTVETVTTVIPDGSLTRWFSEQWKKQTSLRSKTTAICHIFHTSQREI